MHSYSRLIRRRIRCSSSIFCQQECVYQLPTTIRYGSSAADCSSKRNGNVNNPKNSNRVSIRIDTSNGICHVQLDRPNKLNAFDLAMFEAIAETVCNLKNDRSIRAIILSGRGRAFSTGLDVKAILQDRNPMSIIERLLKRKSRPFSAFLDDGDDDDTKSSNITSNLAQDVSLMWRELNVPVIAVLQGMCYGAGLQVALGADFRYSTPDCQLSIMEGKWGLIPDMGASICKYFVLVFPKLLFNVCATCISWNIFPFLFSLSSIVSKVLRELVRIDVAKELTMTGRIISGREAANLGLVTHVCEDPMKEADLLAEQLVKSSPDAIAATKQLFQATWTASSDEECLLFEARFQQKLLLSWNQLAASGRSSVGWNFPYIKRK